MKILTVRLPERLVADIEAESQQRKVSKSDVIRERLQPARGKSSSHLSAIVDLVGSVKGLPSDLSAKKKERLVATSYGKKRPR